MTVTKTQTDIEQQVRDAISTEEPWAFVEKAATLVRLSGNDDERKAIEHLTSRLDAFGVEYTLHTPTCFISWPLGATLRIVGDDAFQIMAKTPSMSISTGGEEREAELVYLSTGYAKDVTDIFSIGEIAQVDLTGKVVITEGMPMPAKVAELTARGAVAAVFVGPGERIHEGICTTIWGSPDLDSMGRQPAISIIAVNNPQGNELIERAKQGGVRVAYSTNLETAWRPIPVLVAEIRGRTLPEEFVLVHSHLDSWHVGIGDNATGDATLLELARVFQQFQDGLTRSVRLAWWSGHSHGRYAGSTWYADTYAIDLAENCVAQVNCDSPGCRWATVFTDVMWTEETAPLAAQAIRDVTGEEPVWARPLRAGDYSFMNLGLSAFFMLSSTMPAVLRKEKGYYAVGGCGGNIAWHTEDDTLEIANRDHLLRDIRLYATAVWRAANTPVPPFDFRLTLDQFTKTLAGYQEQAGDRFDLGPAQPEIARLREALDRFYAGIDDLQSLDAVDPAARRAASIQRKLARLLVPVNYSRAGRFWQDPAESVQPLPDLAVVKRLAKAEAGSHEHNAALVSLQRGVNRLVWALRRSHEVVASGGAVEE
ncbi:MAG: N-acetylated-alpha-linked acidic dipeptidase [Thermomicrobiales bacterium]|nr:N-acetylated-alpha-linked acidic dipeptidase [Thermomicrobiales bacterium]